MALVQCPKCGNQVSNRADSCPHCGYLLGKMVPARVARRLNLEVEAFSLMVAAGFMYGLEVIPYVVPLLAVVGAVFAVILVAYKAQRQGQSLYRAILYASGFTI